MVLLSYSCDTLMIGLALQSALTDWWCLHWIPEPADPSIYTITSTPKKTIMWMELCLCLLGFYLMVCNIITMYIPSCCHHFDTINIDYEALSLLMYS